MNAPGRLRHEAPIARQREDDDHDHDDDTLVEAYLFRNIYKGERGSYNTGSLEHVCVCVCVCVCVSGGTMRPKLYQPAHAALQAGIDVLPCSSRSAIICRENAAKAAPASSLSSLRTLS